MISLSGGLNPRAVAGGPISNEVSPQKFDRNEPFWNAQSSCKEYGGYLPNV
jgi:hypothetical protein